MDQLMQHFLGDVTVTFSQPYNIRKVERDLMSVPGVIGVEGWGGASAEILDDDDELERAGVHAYTNAVTESRGTADWVAGIVRYVRDTPSGFPRYSTGSPWERHCTPW